MQTSRRNLIIAAAAAVIIAIAVGLVYWQQAGPRIAEPWPNATELLKPGPLPEIELGAKDAPITVIEYASATCIHCANFHVNVYPAFKEKFIDTGRVRFIFREFPFDPLAHGAFMLARCLNDTQKYLALIDLLFHQHATWTKAPDPVNALFNLSKQAGYTEESFDSCLANRQLFKDIEAIKEKAEKKFAVDSTPTFFVNGQMASGVQSIEDFEKLFASAK